jgi:hypothetical protein
VSVLEMGTVYFFFALYWGKLKTDGIFYKINIEERFQIGIMLKPQHLGGVDFEKSSVWLLKCGQAGGIFKWPQVEKKFLRPIWLKKAAVKCELSI